MLSTDLSSYIVRYIVLNKSFIHFTSLFKIEDPQNYDPQDEDPQDKTPSQPSMANMNEQTVNYN